MTAGRSNQKSAFTLVELLTVIAVIAVLAAFLIPTINSVGRKVKISRAQAELEQIETALENYKAKYGSYPPGSANGVLLNQLYYELGGVNTNGSSGATINYQTLDGAYSISGVNAATVFGVGGFINCTKGSGEDAVQARDFLSGLKSSQVVAATNTAVSTLIPYLVTSVGGPDTTYQPAYGLQGNPIRYLYPGTNNPGSYDLWIQLSIGTSINFTTHTTNYNMYLVCNWSQQPLHNVLSVP